jgi:hypothetical protein
MMWSDKTFAMYMGDAMAPDVDAKTYGRDVTRTTVGRDVDVKNVIEATEWADEHAARRDGWFARARSAITNRAQVARG